MSAFFGGRLGENPHVGRQLASSFTAGKLAMTFQLVAGTLLVANGVALGNLVTDESGLLARGGAGRFLGFLSFLVLQGLLTLILPVRTLGAIDGPRVDRVFDQVVVTGLSPIRLHLGNWALTFLFGLGVLATSLPFLLNAYLLGGISSGEILAGYALLAAYSVLVITLTLAFSLQERERVIAALASLLLLIVSLVGVAPVPPALALLTPLRTFARPLLEGTPVVSSWHVDPTVHLWTLSPLAYQILLWCLVTLLCAGALCLGPALRFGPELSSFGSAAGEGGGRRPFFRNARVLLERRVELRFFYENRPRWIDSIEAPYRLVSSGLLMFVLWCLITGSCFPAGPSFGALSFPRSLPHVLSVLLTGLVLFIGLSRQVESCDQVLLPERVGPLRVPRGVLLLLFAVLALAAFRWLHGSLVQAAAASLRAAQAGGNEVSGARSSFVDTWQGFADAALLLCANMAALGAILSLSLASRAFSRFTLLVAFGTILCAPLVLRAGIPEGWAPPRYAPLLYVSPISILLPRPTPRQLVEADNALADLGTREGTARALRAQRLLLIGLGGIASIALARALARQRRGLKPLTPVCLALGAAFSVPAVARAQDSNLTLPVQAQLEAGFDGTVHALEVEGSTNHFTLTLKSLLDRPLTGTFVFAAGDRLVTIPRPFTLPPGTTQVVRWLEDNVLESGWATLQGSDLVLAAEGRTLRVPVVPGYWLQPGAGFGLLVTEDGRPVPWRTNNHIWQPCRSRYLPEDVRAYLGIHRVVIQDVRLGDWTRRQRDALFDYLRLGGCVVLAGSVEHAGLDPAEPWIRFLSGTPGTAPRGAGSPGALVNIEGASPVDVPGLDGGGPPLLTGRPVGVGFLQQLRLDPGSPGGLERAVPALEHLLGTGYLDPAAGIHGGDSSSLRDLTSLLITGGFFTIYALILGPAVFLVIRSKTRRRLVWLCALLAPLGGAALLLLLHAGLRARPSYASLLRLDLFPSGSVLGTSFASLEVVSSGRQALQLTLEGKDLSAISPRAASIETGGSRRQQEERLGAFLPLGRAEPGGTSLALSCEVPPWGRRFLQAVGSVELDRPFSGELKVDRSQQVGTLTLRGLPPLVRGHAAVLHLRWDTAGIRLWLPLTAERLRDEEVRLRLPLKEREAAAQIPIELLGRQVDELFRLGTSYSWRLPSEPAAYLIFPVEEAGITLQTRDMLFEKPVEDERLAAALKGIDSLPRPYIWREGRLHTSFSRAFKVFQILLRST